MLVANIKIWKSHLNIRESSDYKVMCSLGWVLTGLHILTYHKAIAPRIIIGRLFPTLKVDLSLCIPIKGLEIKVKPANRNEVTHANWALTVNSEFFARILFRE